MYITLEDVIEEVGEYKRCRQYEYEFQCPHCAENGGDRHCNNLKFNSKKNILYCFANPEHSKQIFNNIIQKKQFSNDFDFEKTAFSATAENATLSDDELVIFKGCMLLRQQTLLQSQSLIDCLFKHRGITKDTVKDVFLGFDEEFNYWSIPTIEYNAISNFDYKVVGFEFRPINFSKQGLTRTQNTPTPLAMINRYKDTTECLAIVEGYFDGYALYQHLKERNQIEKYQIVTCSNGVQSLLKKIDTINFTKYKKIYLFIDNDEVSRPIATQIIERYPFIQNVTLTCGCKDFNEHYIKCIKKIK